MGRKRAKNYWMFSMYKSGTVLSILHIIFHLLLTMILRNSCYYHFHSDMNGVKNGCLEGLSNFLMIKQLLRGCTRIWTQTVWLQNSWFKYITELIHYTVRIMYTIRNCIDDLVSVTWHSSHSGNAWERKGGQKECHMLRLISHSTEV